MQNADYSLLGQLYLEIKKPSTTFFLSAKHKCTMNQSVWGRDMKYEANRLKKRQGDFHTFSIKKMHFEAYLGPYFKSELELKSNSSEILSLNCKFICNSTVLQLKLTKLKLEILKFDIQHKKDIKTDKLAIKWQNFARVRLQLKFAFIIRPLDLISALKCTHSENG